MNRVKIYLLVGFVLMTLGANAQTDSLATNDFVAVDSLAVDSLAVEPDSLLLLKKERVKRALRYDRGLAFDTKTPSMPKGLFAAGLALSYSQHSNDDYSLLILNGLNSKGNMLGVSPMLHYVFANNQSIGVRFDYRRMNLSFNMNPEDLAISTGILDLLLAGDLRYKYASHTYMGYVSYRYYVGFPNMRRLVFFNEVQLGFGGGQQREEAGTIKNPSAVPDPETGEMPYRRQTHQKTFNFRIGFSPGVTFFMTNSLAMEVQIGLLGYEFKKVTQTSTKEVLKGTDYVMEEKKGGRTSSKVSTKFDFLSIAFGMSFYI